MKWRPSYVADRSGLVHETGANGRRSYAVCEMLLPHHFDFEELKDVLAEFPTCIVCFCKGSR